MPRCTIIIPVFNSAETLDACIDSARGQSETDLEIIIVDDGSTDCSSAIAARHRAADDRILLLANDRNCGKSTAMNRAHRVARGDWIAVLDADDAYFPQRIATLVASGERRGVDLVADNQQARDSLSGRDEGLVFDIGCDCLELGVHQYVDSIARKIDFGTLKPIIRRLFLESAGVTYNEQARFAQDFYFLLELLLTGAKITVLREAYYSYTLPFSRRTRKWTSTGSGAWRHNFASALTTNETYRRDARVVGDPHVAAMLALRSRLLERNHKWNVVKRTALDGGLVASLVFLMVHPKFLRAVSETLLRAPFGE